MMHIVRGDWGQREAGSSLKSPASATLDTSFPLGHSASLTRTVLWSEKEALRVLDLQLWCLRPSSGPT